MLAEMATMIESAKALVYKAAWHLDKGFVMPQIFGHV
jgi:alkylation response protein AidB-like acyl-CoA dehydrogenase